MTIVALHSSGLSGRQWQRLVEDGKARGIEVVTPDLAGHGRAPPIAEGTPLSFRDDVATIAELLRSGAPPIAEGTSLSVREDVAAIAELRSGARASQREEDAIDLVGHSYGGLVALQAAVAAPARVRTLQLYDPVAFGVLDRERDADARAELDAIDLRWTDREAWLTRFVDYWGGTGAWAALREPVRAEFRRVAWAVYQGVHSLMIDTTPVEAYARLAMPIQLVTGEHTPIAARRVIERLAAATRNATVKVIAGAGHMGPMSHAPLVDAALLDFVA